MASTTNKPFHTYENVGYDDQVVNSHYVTQPTIVSTNTTIASTSNGIAINKTAIESPFPDPMNGKLMP